MAQTPHEVSPGREVVDTHRSLLGRHWSLLLFQQPCSLMSVGTWGSSSVLLGLTTAGIVFGSTGSRLFIAERSLFCHAANRDKGEGKE